MSNLTDFFPRQSTSTSASDVNALSADLYVDVILVAGGGGGSATTPSTTTPYGANCCAVHGGGAGGYFRGRYGVSSGKPYPVVIGGGGAAAPSTAAALPTSQGGRGGDTTFDCNKLVAWGGGGSGSFCKCLAPSPYTMAICAIQIPGGNGGVGGFGYYCGSSVQSSSRFGCHSNACNPVSSLNGLPLSFTGCPSLSPGVSGGGEGSNTGNGGRSTLVPGTPGAACAGGSGFAVISYPTNSAPAATSTPGAVNCSPQTPGYYTYVYTSTGSFTL